MSDNRTVFRTGNGTKQNRKKLTQNEFRNGHGLNTEGMIRGYFRFEPGDSEAQKKIEALIEAGVTSGNIFFETAGSEELSRLVRLLRRGDTLVVSRVADVCRNKQEMAELIEKLERKGAAIRALDEPWLDFNRGAAGDGEDGECKCPKSITKGRQLKMRKGRRTGWTTGKRREDPKGRIGKSCTSWISRSECTTRTTRCR